jgi:lysophospholipase L1-like esterase
VPFAGFNNQSVRMIVRTSISGESVRIRLANTFGDRHVTVGHATVAFPETDTPERNDVDAATVHEVTFGGSPSVLIPKGSETLSDPVAMAVPALHELVVTIHLPTATGPPTFHSVGSAQIYVGAGDLAAEPAGTAFTGIRTNLYYLAGIDVQTRWSLGSVVALGDSIVDGAFSTFNGYTRWTDRLAERLQAERPLGPFEIGVLNQGIGGNQLTHDGSEVGTPPVGSPGLGINGLARLDKDVFDQPGIRAAFVCLGVNDIQLANDPAERIIAGLRQAANQLRAKNLIAIGCIITPFEGYVNWTPEKEVTRQAVNDYLRTTSDFHAVVDFASAVADPAQPTRLLPAFDSGDHIHPNPAGYTAMGDAIPLRVMS